MKGIALIYDETLDDTVKKKIVPQFGQHVKIVVPFKNELDILVEDDDYVVTYLSDAALKEFLPLAIDRNWKIGFLPHPKMIHARHGFGISAVLEDAITHLIATETTKEVDMLLINGIPVFDTVVIGESLSVMYGSTELTKAKRLWGRAKSFFKLFESVSLTQYTIEYKEKAGKDKQRINTAALGMLIVQHGRSSLLSRRVLENSYINDGLMHNLILAPQSVLGLVKFGIVSLFRTSKNPKLPPFAAHIKTNGLTIKSKEAVNLSIDQVLLSAKEIEVTVVPKNLRVVPGVKLNTQENGNSKEIFKIHSLPTGEQRDELLRGPLPLINHATTEQFTELFTTLRENSRPASSYLVLMILSTFIATLGLFSNSAPVVIGAMILAPLMAPIISLSMGVLRQDSQLIRYSLKSIALGMLLGYICAILITWMTPITVANLQIMARTRPNLLDLGIAVGSGIAGAYAHAKKEVAKTLAGVAIAVALVPPLAVSGIGLGWLNWPVFSGALLLLITNLVGIVLAAAVTFLFLGFSPFRLAKKGLFIALVFVLLVTTPLALGFSRMVTETRIIQNLSGYRIDSMVIRDVEVRQADPLELSITIFSERPLTEADIRMVKHRIEDTLKQEVSLEIRIGIKI